jgi:hypothetical protein
VQWSQIHQRIIGKVLLQRPLQKSREPGIGLLTLLMILILINTHTPSWRTGLRKKIQGNILNLQISLVKGKGMNDCVMLKGMKRSLQIAQMNQYTYSIALDP